MSLRSRPRLLLVAFLACFGSGCGDKAAPSAPVAEPPCTPGEKRCAADDPGARELCSANSAWVRGTCPGTTTCDPETNACQLPPDAICKPGESKCEGADISKCSTDGMAWNTAPCPSGLVCDGQAPSAQCTARLCTPGEVQCSDDATSSLVCNAKGTARDAKPCSAEQACVEGTCKDTACPLGDIVFVRSTDPSLALGPGYYAAAVVDTDDSTDDQVDYPVTIAGTVTDQDATFLQSPVPPFGCGTARVHAHVPSAQGSGPTPPPGLAFDVGDTRIFHFLDPENWNLLERQGVLRAIGETVNFWEDQTDLSEGEVIDAPVLADLVKRLDGGVAPRVEAILGPLSDVDGNQRADVFFTNLLPASNVAAFVWPRVTLPAQQSPDDDHGEIIYSQGPGGSVTTGMLAQIVAHEMGHLVVSGQRFAPYLDQGPWGMPDWTDAEKYVEEGLVSMTSSWTGQAYDNHFAYQLTTPGTISLFRLLSVGYFDDLTANLSGYGLGTVASHYLFSQAGGIAITGPGSVQDLGGLAWSHGVVSKESGVQRIAPVDGRPVEEWFAHLGAALLATTLEGQLSDKAASDKRFQFAPTTKDATFGGWNGPPTRREWTTLQGEPGPMLRRTQWSKRGKLRVGGMSFVEFRVTTDNAKVTIARPTTVAMVVRYKP
jgi:hypothetical protein